MKKPVISNTLNFSGEPTVLNSHDNLIVMIVATASRQTSYYHTILLSM